MKRVALRLPDDGVWTAGVNYLENVCRALLAHPEFGYEPVVFCNSDATAELQERFRKLIGSRFITDPDVSRQRRAGLRNALLTGQNRAAATLCVRHHCAVIMEAADYLGWRFPAACMVWVPDFQDRHLPKIFTPWDLFRKYWALRLQIATRRVVLVSSNDARADCEHFYPEAIGRVAMARFAVQPALAPGEWDPAVLTRHGLPDRFLYLPNQYWIHKNHAGVIDALKLLRDRGQDLIVASSGNPQDPRHKHHYQDLRAKVESFGLTRNFLFLGNIPRADVAHLMRGAVAMVNPSFFEGWSTTVEEAKSLGARMLLSDLRVHREQVQQDVAFFKADEPAKIAEAMEQCWNGSQQPPNVADQQRASHTAVERIREFAGQFAQACDLALRCSTRSG